MHHFDLDDLRLLSLIADEGQLTRAAQRACLSAPAASLRIKRFESALGVTLCRRTPQGLELTPAGECVNRAAHDIALRLDRLADELHPFVRLELGAIRVVGNYGASMDILPNIITKFLLENPEHHVNLSRRTSEDVVEQVSSARADIGVCVPVSARKNVRYLPYIQDYLVLIVPEAHPLAKKVSIDMIEALQYAFIVLSPDVPMQAYVHQKLKEQDLHLHERLEADDQHLLMQFVKNGLGIGVLTLRTARYAPSGIKIVRLKDEWATRPLQIVVPKDPEKLSDNVKRFLDFLLENRPSISEVQTPES